ncbi:uncharacterized protein LOC120708525 isoform X2 [Panicum virgatum]|uniref:DUF4378 domain-containing protein n=1 Tax=Panicum virgatum TaxID=38727 RepID=A0A8T0XK81_PANVG|nr:uncharacterized protein LOC120708525 isoform X2 [Panicum virgatum]KAG2659855.1 hypothetical protein PVAP13_1KG215240 [Panicum virgatum]KAG2659857.1 hypothetical protein PVAP13_1KG215240 [Panicum virgatum]
MSGVKSVIGQAPGDGLPVQRIISELKKITNPVEEKSGANGSSSSRKSNATSLKMLLEKEMAKEVESKRRPPSVIGRLMGLEEDLPTEESIVHHTKVDLTRDLNASNKTLHGKEHHQSIRLKTQDHQSIDETIGYNDVYEVSEQQSRTSYFQDQTSLKGWPSENKSKQFDIVQEKFIKPKYFAMEEKLLHIKELQEALEVPCSNKDLFLETPEEHSSSFSRQLSGLHTNQAPPQKKRITVLMPIKSVEINSIRQSRTEQVSKQNVLNMRKFHQIPSPKEEISSQPSRIVLLRPTPGKPSTSKAKLTSRENSFRLINQNSLNGSIDYSQATVGSSELVHDVMQHRQDGCHQRDDSLLSSAYSNGYGGDESSFSDSEVDYSSGSEMDCIEDGGTLSNSEGGSPLSKHSWNCRGYENPYSSSSLSKISHFSESSVIREAKKQLSERWAVVCDYISQEQVQSSRRTCTLGEMLSIKEAKKEDVSTEILSASSNRSCSLDNELTTRFAYVTSSRKNGENGERSPRKLPRSNSLPVISSTFGYMVVDVQASNPDSRKLKMVVVSNKGKSSLKGRVSDFFLSRSKKPTRQRSTYHPSDCVADRLEACIVRKAVDCEDRIDSFSTQKSTSMSERSSIGATISLDCPRGSLDKLGVNKGLNSNRDQPSPTSVLDAPSEDSSCNEPEISGRTSKNTISRSSAIETVARFLSWDDSASESQLLCTPRTTSLMSDVDDDESECHVLVQNIMSSAGLGSSQSSMVFTGWHLPNYPRDPVLCDKVSELEEKSSYRRLLFDCVNIALIEIGENALLGSFPWSKRHWHSRTWRNTSSPDLGVEVWSILKDWIYGARMFVVSRRDNAGIMLDRIVKQEVEGRGWVNSLMLQVVDITEHLEGGVMEELVEEAVLDFAVCSQR